MKLWRTIIGIGLLGMLMMGNLHAEDTLKIGIKPSEPWVMYDGNLPPEHRQPKGFSIDLWDAIAQQLGTKTEWVYFDTVQDLINATEKKQVDASIAAITVTSERETQVDFSNSMYELGLQIMIPGDSSPNPWLVAIGEIGKLFTWHVLLVLLGLIVLFAHVRWLVDGATGKDDQPTFAPDYRYGIIEALWWALTMFFTWDTPPRRGLARFVDLIWFLMGFLCLGILSSVITAGLTEQNISSNIQSVQDLVNKRVAAVATDAPRQYLSTLGINAVPVKDLAEGMQKLANKEVDALVHDGPRLVYLAGQHNQSVSPQQQVVVLPASFNKQTYSIAFPTNSKLVEPVNHALMKLREGQAGGESFYEGLRKRWLPN
jgi:polar amino acid transport system substrate-binding protein